MGKRSRSIRDSVRRASEIEVEIPRNVRIIRPEGTKIEITNLPSGRQEVRRSGGDYSPYVRAK